MWTFCRLKVTAAYGPQGHTFVAGDVACAVLPGPPPDRGPHAPALGVWAAAHPQDLHCLKGAASPVGCGVTQA